MRGIALALLVTTGLVQTAFAMDVPADAPVTPAPVQHRWGGFYGGLKSGSTWYNADPTATGGGAFSAPGAFPLSSDFIGANQPGLRPNSLTGGMQLGYNWQRGQMLFGWEADANTIGVRQSIANPAAGTIASLAPDGSISTSYVATLRPRVGIVADRWMVYATGGLAMSAWKTDDSLNFSTLGAGASASQTKLGWTVGGGAEWVVTPDISAKVEYQYLDLGKQNGAALSGSSAPADSFASRFTANIIRFGLNFKFEGWK